MTMIDKAKKALNDFPKNTSYGDLYNFFTEHDKIIKEALQVYCEQPFGVWQDIEDKHKLGGSYILGRPDEPSYNGVIRGSTGEGYWSDEKGMWCFRTAYSGEEFEFFEPTVIMTLPPVPRRKDND